MVAFKPAYLIKGDDHGRIAERRNRLRELAEAQSGAQGVELLGDEASSPEAVAYKLSVMTFALGRRFIIVDGVERWKDKDLEPLEAALAAIPPDTTVAFFAREDSRSRVPKGLHRAVEQAGGDVSAAESVTPWELPRWVIARARELQLTLEPDAARALIGHVGERQQRLLRELEKLSLGSHSGASLEANEVEELTALSAEHRAWSLADALVGGDVRAALGLYLALRADGERLPPEMPHFARQASRRGEVWPPAEPMPGLRLPPTGSLAPARDRIIRTLAFLQAHGDLPPPEARP